MADKLIYISKNDAKITILMDFSINGWKVWTLKELTNQNSIKFPKVVNPSKGILPSNLRKIVFNFNFKVILQQNNKSLNNGFIYL